MFAHLKKYIKKKILNFISNNWDNITYLSNEKKLISLKSSLKKCGENLQIETPFFVEGYKYISIGDNFRCRNNLRIEALNEYGNQKFNPEVIIGSNVTVEAYLHIGCIKKVTIGDGVLIASNVLITDHFHGDFSKEQLELEPLERKLFSKGEVIIGNNVWIGENVTILSGVNIGNNVIVGAKSLVLESFGSNCVIAGIPAKIIRKGL